MCHESIDLCMGGRHWKIGREGGKGRGKEGGREGAKEGGREGKEVGKGT